MNNLDYIRQYRHMPWLKCRMRAKFEDQQGHVTRGTGGGNLRFKPDNGKRVLICHPQWRMTYYDKSGKIIAEY